MRLAVKPLLWSARLRCRSRETARASEQGDQGGYWKDIAAFDPEVELTHPADYLLMMNTFVTLFWRSDILQRSLDELVALGYDAVRVDATAWTAERDLHRDVAAALNFPSYYGRNLAALNDCLSDVGSMEYGTSPEATGLVLAIIGYDRFFAIEPYTAHKVLDIFAHQARHAALIGHRTICLVQTDDPQIASAPVGAMPVAWNAAEWLNSSRTE